MIHFPRIVGVLSLTLSSFLFSTQTSAQILHDTPSTETVMLDQGWSLSERDQFYFITQGSQLIPYDWFLGLECADNKDAFMSDKNLERFRFITQRPTKARNPDGLPIGLVLDDNPLTVRNSEIKRAFLGPEFPQLKPTDFTNRWLGLTCAACHTADIKYADHTIRIDGGAAMVDVQSFLKELTAALEKTINDPEKLDRFAKNVLEKTGTGYSTEERDALLVRMKNYAPALTRLVRRGTGTHPYGYGRLDAFGAILNEVCDTSLNQPKNYYPSDAPASFPFLWGAPQLDWVQWNGSAANPLARNIGQVIGVFGQVNLLPESQNDRFKSTAHFSNLIRIENQLNKLRTPVWPADVLGSLDEARIVRGKELYVKNCASCHALKDPATNNYPLTQPNKFGKQFVRTHMIPVQQIATDPQLVINFTKRDADPGSLREASDKERIPRPEILKRAVKGAIEKNISEHQPKLDKDTILEIQGFRNHEDEAPNPGAYKARPLDGIWATAPYLHNGSVPNLYEILLPSTRRSSSFYVGSREFDPKKVGFITENRDGSWKYEIEVDGKPIAGNSNKGHEGHGPGENLGFTETFENGKWREFTDEERWDLVEFMKSLGRYEAIPANEEQQIKSVIESTIQQLQNRYSDEKRVLRGVHPKDHGCVKAEFEVLADLPKELQAGVFATPGKRYESWVRYSNAAALVLPDDSIDKDGKATPGSRGMAIKLLGVEGDPLTKPLGEITQDFLLVNHPVFAFANVEDYEVLSKVLADPFNRENPKKFFDIQLAKRGLAADRAKISAGIIERIRATNVESGAYQPQPACPTDCRYFSAAPFLFGDDVVVKFAVTPESPVTNGKPNSLDPNYLRHALIERLKKSDEGKPVVLNFQIQKRLIASLDIPIDIENACNEWPEEKFPFITVAKLTIPLQDFDSPESRAFCEQLFFTPWHGLKDHRPLGGINRMRRLVYEASSNLRHHPKEPTAK